MLILIESTDVLFAIDSIPAIFAVTRDTFIVFTSNIFALLGMRALYFLLAGAAQRFVYLQTGLGIILAGVGAKLLLTDVYQIPTWASLVFILPGARRHLRAVLAGHPPQRHRRARAGPPRSRIRPPRCRGQRDQVDGSRPVRMRVIARSNKGSSWAGPPLAGWSASASARYGCWPAAEICRR